MANRGYAQIFTSIWSDEDFRALSPAGQRQYLLLLSQPEVNYAGVLALTERRWARCCESTSLSDIQAAVAELAERTYVVVDFDTEELLVRSFVRNDGLWKQPRMLAVAIREALGTASRGLREALADEFGRVCGLIPARDPVDDRIGMLSDAINKLLGGPEHTPPEAMARGLGRASAGPGEGSARAQARHLTPNTINKTPPGGAAGKVTPDRAREEDRACDCAPAIARAHEEPPLPSIPDRSPPEGITGPSAADAYRLVDAAIGREHPHAVRTALAIEAGTLLRDGTERELVFSALSLWLAKPHLGPRSLAGLVSEAIRNRNRPRKKGTTDQRTSAIQALKSEFALGETTRLALPGGESA